MSIGRRSFIREAILKAVGISAVISTVESGGAALIGAGSPAQTAGTSPELFKRSLAEFGFRSIMAGGTDQAGLIGAVTQFGTATFNQDAFGMSERRTTAAANGSEARIISGNAIAQRRHNPIIISKFRLNNLANVRFWIGLFSSPSIAVPSNDPLSHLAGMRFSTSAGDTNFMFAVEDAVTLNLFDTGIAANTNVHYLIMKIDNSVPNVTIELRNVNFVLEASNVFTTNLPSATANLFYHLYSLITLEAVAKSFDGLGNYCQRFINLDVTI